MSLYIFAQRPFQVGLFLGRDYIRGGGGGYFRREICLTKMFGIVFGRGDLCFGLESFFSDGEGFSLRNSTVV